MSKPSDPRDDIIFQVFELYVQLDTNTGPNGESKIELFKRSMLKLPKMDTPPILNSEFPLFTKDVRYPRSLERESWKTKYEFLFNRDLFVERLRKEVESNSESFIKTQKGDKQKWKRYTEMQNIMVTLRLLFPIPEVFGKVLKNSFDNIINTDSNSRIIWDVDIRNTLNVFGFMYKFGITSKEKDEYFINIGGKKYSVDDVVWENDVVNNPVYNKFLMAQREAYETVLTLKDKVRSEYDKYANDLISDFVSDIEFDRNDPNPSKPNRSYLLHETIRNIKERNNNSGIDKKDSSLVERSLAATRIVKNLEQIDAKEFGWYSVNRSLVAKTILSVEEEMEYYAKIAKNSNKPSTLFMDRTYAELYDKHLEKSIKVIAAGKVLNFVEDLVPMRMATKNFDGTDVTQITIRINNYVKQFFPTETEVNNSLITSVDNIYEPRRKTSNTDLYQDIITFKRGSNQRGESVFTKIYNKYISAKKYTFSNEDNEKINRVVYTGIDEVNNTRNEQDKSNPGEGNAKSVQEIYVRLDLVNSETFEKTSRASCKLLDKELEQDFMYLADPLNKENKVLSRFRNLDFESVIPNMITQSDTVNIENKKGGKNNSKRVRLYGRNKSLKRIR
jgi:hypothetical protein